MAGNKDNFLSLEFGVEQLNEMGFKKRLAAYREFVYEIGSLVSNKGKSIDLQILEKQRAKGFKISSMDCLKHKTRYFTDSAIIGSRKFVSQTYSQFNVTSNCAT